MPVKDKKMKEPLTQAEEEEMSSAYIAKLLAEDAMGDSGNADYYAEYSNSAAGYDPYHAQPDDDDDYADEGEDDSYAPKRKTKGRGRPAKSSKSGTATPAGVNKRGRKRKTTDAEVEPSFEKQATVENTDGGDGNSNAVTAENEDLRTKKPATKKPRKPVPEGFNTGTYTEEEENRFIEGLEIFGRDWPKLVAHIATRDANSIRSHAQKHFIKLFRDQIPLPEKVRETGEGYTLSGKPLDPESSAAKPYLGRASTSSNHPKPAKASEKKEKVETTAATATTDTAIASAGVEKAANKELIETTATDLKVGEPEETKTAPATAPAPAPAPAPSTAPALVTLKENNDKDLAIAPNKRPISPSTYDENGRTDYSKRKLRRARERPSVMYSQISKDDDPLTMVKCEPFTGKPGSTVNGCQPFEMEVHSNVMLAMDFHAHLMTTEIIGFLAGEWDKDKKKMCIKEAFPCRSLNTGQNDVNVEMDPTSDIETRQLIHDKNLTVVGWYHSHPTFVPDPSITDLENQRNYQFLCREKCENLGRTFEPFVGAIVGPYDPRLPGSASVINWFYVSNSLDERWVPKRLIYDLQEDTELSDEHSERLLRLVREYKDSPEKVDFTDMWRQDIHESKLEKLIKSLGARMPWAQKSPEQIDSFLTSVRDSLQEW